MAHLYSMINVPTKLATLTVSNAIDNHNTMLAVVRLNNTRARINFQKVPTTGTRPINP